MILHIRELDRLTGGRLGQHDIACPSCGPERRSAANRTRKVLRNDLLGLAICEGIEDALSLHAATGLGAWAAGSASRLPTLSSAIPSYVECITVLVDDDPDGKRHAGELARRLKDHGIDVQMILPNTAGRRAA